MLIYSFCKRSSRSLQISQKKKLTIHSFTKGLHLVRKNVSGLASEVGRLIYSTQRHSSKFVDLAEEENDNPFIPQKVF